MSTQKVKTVTNVARSLARNTFVIIFTLLPLSLLTKQLPIELFGDNREQGPVEIIQLVILFCCLAYPFTYRKLFIRKSNLFVFCVRQLFLLFLFYEEISFLTKNVGNTFSSQSELNVHNAFFFGKELFSLKIPLTHISYTLNLYLLVYALALFVIGYGSYFRGFRKVKDIFLERELSVFTFTYVANTLLVSISYDLQLLGISTIQNIIAHEEIIELFLYSIFLVDVFEKKLRMESENSNATNSQRLFP